MNVTVNQDEAKKIEAFMRRASEAGYTEDEIKSAIQQKYGRKPAPVDPKQFDPTEGMSTTEKLLAGVGKAFVDAGRGVGQLTGDVAEGVGFNRPSWAPTEADISKARELDAPLMKTGAGVTGNVLGNIASFAPLALIPGANTIAGGATIGALTGAAMPVAEGDSRGGNAAIGGVAGGALPAAARAYRVGKAALVDPFTEAGRQRIVGGAMNRAAGDKNKAVANLLSRRGVTPGFNPTAGQASGDSGIASLERAAEAIDPGGFQNIRENQRAALVNALRSVAGTPEAKQAAIDAREAATNPLYEAAKGKVVADDGALAKLLQRPSMSAAQARAMQLAKERGEVIAPKAVQSIERAIDTNKDDVLMAVRKLGGISQQSFDDMFGQSVRNGLPFQPSFYGPVFSKTGGKGRGVDEIARELYQKGYLQADDAGELLDKIVDTGIHGNPVFSVFKDETANDPLTDAIKQLTSKLGEKNAPAAIPSVLKDGKVSGKALHDIKMGLDDAIGVPGQGGLQGAERAAALGTKSDFLNWLETNIPEYGQARTAYADMSKPISQMDIGQELYNRFVPALADNSAVPFKSRADAYANALRNGDQLARSVTGMKGATLEGTMTPEQLALLRGVSSDAAMVSSAQAAGRGVGSDTVQKMAMSNILNEAGVPTWIQSVGRVPGGWLRTLGDILYTKNDDALRNALADIIQDPQAAAQAMQMAKTDPTKFMQVMKTLGQGTALSLPSTVNAVEQ